jgi:hypothetical protein
MKRASFYYNPPGEQAPSLFSFPHFPPHAAAAPCSPVRTRQTQTRHRAVRQQTAVYATIRSTSLCQAESKRSMQIDVGSVDRRGSQQGQGQGGLSLFQRGDVGMVGAVLAVLYCCCQYFVILRTYHLVSARPAVFRACAIVCPCFRPGETLLPLCTTK